MKKSSLMGASVVAAALLAAAPVVAPVASLATPGTQVVKADDNTLSEGTKAVAKKITGMATDTTITAGTGYGKLGDFSDRLNLIPKLADYRTTTHKFALGGKLNDVQQPFTLTSQDPEYSLKVNDSFAPGDHVLSSLLKYFFNGQNQVNLVSSDNVIAAQSMSYTIQFEYSNAINNNSYDIKGLQDVRQVRTDLANNGGTVTMTMQLYDGEGRAITNNGVLKSTVSYNVNNARAAYVNYADTLSAHVGDSANVYNLANSFINANGQIRDYNGNDITTTAFNNNAISVTPLVDKNGHAVDASLGVVNGNFTKSGQFYQKVVINLKHVLGAQTANWTTEQWQDAVRGGLITVNGQTPSLTNADANVYLVTTKDTNVDNGKYQPGQLILKRTVNVDVDQGAFKSEKVNGIVTVNMNNGMAAQVYDENGKLVLGRALPNKSAWTTGEKRTYYKDGQVFYQVSTYEYVRAQDVTFSEPFQDSVVRGNVTITKYPDQVITTVNDPTHLSVVYALDSDGNGFHATSRALAANTKWRNGAKAEVNGKTFYQISTNEWLNSSSLAD